MLLVGELINASRKSVAAAIETQDKDFIQNLAKDQFENGAAYIDVNAGVFLEKETEYLKWLVEIVQEAIDAPCCIDSPNPKAIEAALSVHKGTAMINSISMEKDRLEDLLTVVAGTDLKVVTLCMDDAGMPKTADERVVIAEKLVDCLNKNSVPMDNIYVDPLVQPIATDVNFGIEFLAAIERIMAGFEGIHTICGLSNISFGLPERKFLNQLFVVMAMAKGLDAAIIDPLDKRMVANILAADALRGKDEYCRKYLGAFRAEKLKF
jgi:5-methyltetrahydrofolate--homocysteine methyltransferase